MSTMDKKDLTRKLNSLEKLKSLAERGTDEERKTAKRKIALLMEKYQISEEELNDESIEYHDFHYHNENEKKLLVQIFYKVLGKDYRNKVYAYRGGRGSRSVLGVECTKSESVQIGIEYDFYKTLWDEECSFFLECFIRKHRLFATDPEQVLKNAHDDSCANIERMLHAMNAMKEKSLVAQLSDNNTLDN